MPELRTEGAGVRPNSAPWFGLRTIERGGEVAAALLLALALLPLVVLGRDASGIVHDDMDGIFARLAMIARSPEFFAGPAAPVLNVMNGQPRVCFPSALHVLSLLFHMFDPWVAYLVNQVVIRVVGFAGMRLLVRDHLAPGETGRLIAPWVGVAFAVLPFYCLFGLSITGLPLLAASLLRISQADRRWRNYAVIVAFAFYSSFVLVGAFVIALVAGWCAVEWLRRRRAPFALLAALLLLAACYGVSEYQLVCETVTRHYVFHRVEMRLSGSTLGAAYAAGREILLYGQYHAMSAHRLILWCLPGAIVLALVLRHRCRGPLLGMACAVVLIAGLYGLFRWERFRQVAPGAMNYFQADRFYLLYPPLWYGIFACELAVLLDGGFALARRSRMAAWPLAFAALVLWSCQARNGYQAVVAADGFAAGMPPFATRPDLARQIGLVNEGANELYYSLRKWLRWPRESGSYGPSYATYYDEEVFGRIRDFIGRPQREYRVISIGLHPSAALMSGFHCLDAYQPIYLLEYKHAFRRIIAGELAGNPVLADAFDNWGSRCYAFVHDPRPGAPDDRLENLAFDWAAFRGLGGEYVLSVLPLHAPGHLEFQARFSSAVSARVIYLYRLSVQTAPDGAKARAGAVVLR